MTLRWLLAVKPEPANAREVPCLQAVIRSSGELTVRPLPPFQRLVCSVSTTTLFAKAKSSAPFSPMVSATPLSTCSPTDPTARFHHSVAQVRAQAMRLIVLLNCCHAGGVGDALLHTDSSSTLQGAAPPTDFYRPLAVGSGQVVISSSRPDQKSGAVSQRDPQHTPFGATLLAALRGAAPGAGPAVGVFELFAALHEGVSRDILHATPCEQIKSPADVAALLMVEMAQPDQEEFRVLHLDTKNRLQSMITLYRGSLNSATVRVGEVYKAALRLLHVAPSPHPKICWSLARSSRTASCLTSSAWIVS